jgi:hypothetical protein
VPGPYNSSLISLSVLIAICASFVAISLSGRILVAQGLMRRLWIVRRERDGLGIFSCHIGLLAFTRRLGGPTCRAAALAAGRGVHIGRRAGRVSGPSSASRGSLSAAS